MERSVKGPRKAGFQRGVAPLVGCKGEAFAGGSKGAEPHWWDARAKPLDWYRGSRTDHRVDDLSGATCAVVLRLQG